MSITLWKPEPNVLIHQALGKACEEATELAGILARCLIQGLDASEPATGKPNRHALSDEIADLNAAVQWLRDLTGDMYDEERADRKLHGFHRWQRMLEEDLEAVELPYQCDACSTPGYGADAPCHCSPLPASKDTRHLNIVDGKIYIFISDTDGLVTFKREGRETLRHLSRAEFDKRFFTQEEMR